MFAPWRPAAWGPVSRAALRLLACVPAGLSCGCASYLDVRSLATGRAELAAYELTGSDPAALQQEATRLCPKGAEILRQAVQAQQAQAAEGSWGRWIDRSGEWLEPPRRSAQLVVLCQASAPAWLLSAAAPAVATSAGTAAPTPALPTGPTSVGW